MFFSISAFRKCSNDKSNTNRPNLLISGRAVQFDLKFELLEPFECALINLGDFCEQGVGWRRGGGRKGVTMTDKGWN